MTARVNPSAGAEPPRTLAEQAYVSLRDMIVTLELPPGSALAEDALGGLLEMGRTPLREAVKRLETERLVLIYPRRGSFVAEVNLTDHALISDVRRELEGHAAERAAERATAAQRDALRQLAAALVARAPGREEGMRLDAVVHRQVHACAHNPYLERDLSRYYNLSLRIWYLFLDRLPEVDHTAEHVPVLTAILDGDAGTARKLAVAHVEHFESSVRALL